MSEKHERPIQRRNSRLLIHDSNTSKVLDPIIEYTQEPLVSLVEAYEPLIDIVDDIFKYVAIALNGTPTDPPNNLTKNEAASIYLYTMEWEDGHKSLYSILNNRLRAADRSDLKPWFKYLKLFLTAIAKIPCAPRQTVWRGVRRNVSDEFPPGAQVTWWSFSSCTTSLTVLENDIYLGNAGERTLFSIELFNGRIIRDHSYFDTEEEILMLPGTYMEVQSQFTPAPDLHVIHLKQMKPKEILLADPFQGACIYPKDERLWYCKKRFGFLIAALLALVVLGSVLGSRSINHSTIISSINITNVMDAYPVSAIPYTVKIGQNYSSILTGTTNGSIYGTNIYTDDSNLAKAAVHAGVLRIGETRNITLTIRSGQASYAASFQNGIASSSYGSWSRSYSFVGATAKSNVAPSNLAGYGGKIGQNFSFVITGAGGGSIYGTNIYTDDSNLGKAAVHAGVLRIGETKNITLQILPGQAHYPSSIQNGVSSFSYGAWTGSYSFFGAVGL